MSKETDLCGNGLVFTDSVTGQRIWPSVKLISEGGLNFTGGVCGDDGTWPDDGKPIDAGFGFLNVGTGKAKIVYAKKGYKGGILDVVCPVVAPALFISMEPDVQPVVRPTREQVLAGRSSSCSMRDDLGRVMFTNFIGAFWLAGDMVNFDMWVKNTVEMCCADGRPFAHMEVGFESKTYHNYFMPAFDFTGHEDEWVKMLNHLLDHRCIPIGFLTSGDDAGELVNLEARCKATLPVANYGAWCMGFEMIGSQNPTLSSKQWFDAMNLMRKILGDSAVLIMHVDPAERCTWASARGYDINSPVPGCFWSGSAWVENDDPSGGDEIGAMNMLQIDVYALQTRHGSGGPAGTLGDPNDTNTWSGHCVEIADRFFDASYWIAAVKRFAQGPDWFAGKKCRPRFWIWETIWYDYLPGNCSEQQAIAASAMCRSISPYEGGYRK